MADEEKKPEDEQKVNVSRDAFHILVEVQRLQDMVEAMHSNQEMFLKILTDVHKKISNEPGEASVLIKPLIM